MNKRDLSDLLVVASTDGSKWIALLSDLLTSLVVLGRYGV